MSLGVTETERLLLAQQKSGLTWLTLSYVFGVEEPQLHTWLAGEEIVGAHQETLEVFEQHLATIHMDDPLIVREVLLAPYNGENSWVDQMRLRNASKA